MSKYLKAQQKRWWLEVFCFSFKDIHGALRPSRRSLSLSDSRNESIGRWKLRWTTDFPTAAAAKNWERWGKKINLFFPVTNDEERYFLLSSKTTTSSSYNESKINSFTCDEFAMNEKQRQRSSVKRECWGCAEMMREEKHEFMGAHDTEKMNYVVSSALKLQLSTAIQFRHYIFLLLLLFLAHSCVSPRTEFQLRWETAVRSPSLLLSSVISRRHRMLQRKESGTCLIRRFHSTHGRNPKQNNRIGRVVRAKFFQLIFFLLAHSSVPCWHSSMCDWMKFLIFLVFLSSQPAMTLVGRTPLSNINWNNFILNLKFVMEKWKKIFSLPLSFSINISAFHCHSVFGPLIPTPAVTLTSSIHCYTLCTAAER